MRKLIGVVAFSFLSLQPLAAADIWFDPPNPTSHTNVIAHLTVPQGCANAQQIVQKALPNITINIVSGACGGVMDTAVDLGVLPAGVYTVVSGGSAEAASVPLVVRDADTQLHISPDVGTTGELATLTAPGLGVACTPQPCMPAYVLFGKRLTLVESQTAPDTMVVRVPPEGPGVVDVRVQMANGTVYTATAAFDYFVPARPDRFFFEPVLFPVIISGPGAFGSVWSTQATMRNDTGGPFEVANPIFGRVEAQSTVSNNTLDLPAGYELWIPREAAPKLSFGLLARDLSRQDQTLGVQLPVVREKDFFMRPFAILNVPTDSRYRMSLRVYRSDGGTDAELRILSQSDGTELVKTSLTLTPNGNGYTFAYIGDLLTAFPQLAGKGDLHVEINPSLPAYPGAWAFVSVTNNETQHVTVLTPQ